MENKVDLLTDDQLKSIPESREFSESNKFVGCFRTSAKAGINISESMEFLIKTIVDRMEGMIKSGQSVSENDRKSIVLEKNVHNKDKNQSKKECC